MISERVTVADHTLQDFGLLRCGHTDEEKRCIDVFRTQHVEDRFRIVAVRSIVKGQRDNAVAWADADERFPEESTARILYRLITRVKCSAGKAGSRSAKCYAARSFARAAASVARNPGASKASKS